MNMISVLRVTASDFPIGNLPQEDSWSVGKSQTLRSEGESMMMNWQENLMGSQKQSPQSKYPLPISAAALGFATWAHVLLNQPRPTATFSPSSDTKERWFSMSNALGGGKEGGRGHCDDDSGLVVGGFCEGVGPLSLSASLPSLPTPTGLPHQLKWIVDIPVSTDLDSFSLRRYVI